MSNKQNLQAHPADVVRQYLPRREDMTPCNDYFFTHCLIDLVQDVDPRLCRSEFQSPIDDLFDRISEAGVEDNAAAIIKTKSLLADLNRKWECRIDIVPTKNYTKLTPGGKRCGCDTSGCGSHGKDPCVFEYCFPLPFCGDVEDCEVFQLPFPHTFC